MSEINERIKRCIVERLELSIQPSEIQDDAPLFAPAVTGGMDLDSLAAIEIVVALGVEFNLQFDEVPRDSFSSVHRLGEYVAQQQDRQHASA